MTFNNKNGDKSILMGKNLPQEMGILQIYTKMICMYLEDVRVKKKY